MWVYVERMHGIVEKMNFTLSRYKELCLALLDSGYTPLTVYSYLDKWKGRYDYLSKSTKDYINMKNNS